MKLLHVNAAHIIHYGRGIQIQHEPSHCRPLEPAAVSKAILTIGISLERVPCGMLPIDAPSVRAWSMYCTAKFFVEIFLQTVENFWNSRNYDPWKFSAIQYMTIYSRKPNCKKAVQLLSYLRVGADYFDNVRLNLVQQDCDAFQVPQ